MWNECCNCRSSCRGEAFPEQWMESALAPGSHEASRAAASSVPGAKTICANPQPGISYTFCFWTSWWAGAGWVARIEDLSGGVPQVSSKSVPWQLILLTVSLWAINTLRVGLTSLYCSLLSDDDQAFMALPWNSPGQNTGVSSCSRLFFRGSSQPRDRTQVSCIAGGFFTSGATREAQW